MADRTARAGKASARNRMTKLRELKEANQGAFDRMEVMQRLPFGQRYQQRLRALGAAMEKDPGT